MTIQMKTIKGSTTFDVTVEFEWEIKVPVWVSLHSVEDALGDVSDLDDLEEQVLQYIANDVDGAVGKLYEVTYNECVMNVHGRIDDVCGSFTDIKEDGEVA